MSAFKSVCRRHIREVLMAPHSAILIIKEGMGELRDGKKEIIRSIPYPPSFNRMAARIIEPAIGAST